MVIRNLDENVWDVLLRRIADDKFTPFLGAGACHGSIPMGGEIAEKLALEHDYPLSDISNLINVSQFMAIKTDPVNAKSQILEQFISPANPPDFKKDYEPHGVLAQLPISVYITTNYDDFMFQALKQHEYREPQQFECQWHEKTNNASTTIPGGLEPTPGQPFVFHLHGFSKPEYLVLTENDYLRFLSHMAHNHEMLPAQIIEKLTNSSLVFIGYSLADWNFRVLFENLRATFQYRSIAVLLPPGETDKEKEQAMRYLDDYYRNALELEVYWGKAREFCHELQRRWQEYQERENQI